MLSLEFSVGSSNLAMEKSKGNKPTTKKVRKFKIKEIARNSPNKPTSQQSEQTDLKK